jgi:hypothetical protein
MKAMTLKKLKAKITRLHNTDKKQTFLEITTSMWRKEKTRPYILHSTFNETSGHAYDSIPDCNGITYTGSVGILKTFAEFIQTK